MPAQKQDSSQKWLVRTTKNEILGPFEADELKKRIGARQFSAEDEICKGNQYWIFLREQAEVKALLGLDVSQILFRRDPKANDLEATQTQIGDTEVATVSREFDDLPELDEAALNSEETSLIRNRSMRELPGGSASASSAAGGASGQAPAVPASQSARPAISPAVVEAPPSQRREAAQQIPMAPLRSHRDVPGGMEGPLLYRSLAWVLSVAAGVLVYWVIRLLENGAR